MNVSNIAYTSINMIVKEVFNSYNKGSKFTVERITRKLEEAGVSSEVVNEVTEMVGQIDPFEKAREELENERKRCKFIEGNFKNVKPVTVVLSSKDSPHLDSYQYVPIGQSLKILLEDQTFLNQKTNDPYFHDENLIQDVRDGECYRGNIFFKENPEAVPLILFIDELEVCNPLGAGKTKHKINCSYFSTLQVQPALRSKVNSIQLVSLVKSKVWKKYGNKLCNENLISDLRMLETEGVAVDIPTKKTVRAGLQFVVGDNLGQHNIAELNQSFSSGHICRWCKITYNEACREGLAYADCKDGFCPDRWTVTEYDEKATEAVEGANVTDTYGIKGNCVFNQLKSFHCVLQLPPCLGHDYYEGVWAADIQFYLDYLINKESLISIEEFNKKLKNIQLTSRDSKNRPREFKTRKRGSKYEGSAGSQRVLSRVITVILEHVLDESMVGELIVKLCEVSELVTAPKLTIYEIETNLHFTIIDYLEMRRAAIEDLGMATMKPKHHFLSHYSELYKFHGPLIHLWAMRMESKHQYFKNVIRTSKNFINVTKTCAIRHELAQITHRYNGLFPDKLSMPPNSLCVKEMSASNIKNHPPAFMTQLRGEAFLPRCVSVHGTEYKAGMVVVLQKVGMGEMKVGIIVSIGYDMGRVIFGCTVFEAGQSKNGYYVTFKKVSDLVIVDQTDLADHQPLQRIGTGDKFSFCLHHYVSEHQPSIANFGTVCLPLPSTSGTVQNVAGQSESPA